MLWDLEEELNRILKETRVRDYNIKLNIKEKVVQKVIDSIIDENEDIGMVGYIEDIDIVRKFANTDVKKYVIGKDKLCRDVSGIYVMRADGFFKELASVKLDKLIVVSYDIRHIIEMYLFNYGTSYIIVDLFDCFSLYAGIDLKQSVRFDKYIDFYKNAVKELFFAMSEKKWANNIHIIANTIKSLNTYDNYDALYTRQKLYEQSKDKSIKEWYLLKIIDNCLAIRDFNTAFYYMDIYIEKKYFSYEKILHREELIQKLLDQIRTLLSTRKQRDLLFFWIDGMSSKEREDLKLYSKEADDGILFQNAYTHIPVTRETMYTMMSGLPYFENHVYEWKNVKEGKNYKWLIQKGYDVKEIGGGYISDDTVIAPSRNPHSYYHPTPLVLWKALLGLLSEDNDKPKCYFIHCDCESHNPYWAGNMKQMVIGARDPFIPLKDYMPYVENAEIYQQEQIRWYTNFFPLNACKIYMSDHGKEFPFWKEEKIKTFIIINDLQIKNRKVNAPFSYLDFDKLLKFLVDPENYPIEKVYSECILFQNDDPYQKMANEVLLHNDENNTLYYRQWMGFRGAIKNGKKIVVFRNGKKVILDLSDNVIDEATIKNDEIEELEKLAGSYFGDINSDHFIVASNLYRALNIDF